MERVEQLALICVGRGVILAACGIAVLALGLTLDILSGVKAAGVLTVIASIALVIKAYRAPFEDYKSTEVWAMMAPRERPADTIAQNVIGDALRRTYLTFALHTAGAATGLLLFATVINLVALTR
jgi:hypothetical protein